MAKVTKVRGIRKENLREITAILESAEQYVDTSASKKDLKFIKEEIEFGLTGNSKDPKKIEKEMKKKAEKILKYCAKGKEKKLAEAITEFKVLITRRDSLV